MSKETLALLKSNQKTNLLTLYQNKKKIGDLFGLLKGIFDKKNDSIGGRKSKTKKEIYAKIENGEFSNL
jgi:hypothetical protein